MSWENSKAITALKRDFIKSFFSAYQSFYLTGGSALGIFYLEHRLSFDLDFFTQEAVNWHILEMTVKSIAASIDAECTTLSASPFFYRMQLVRGSDREILDFVMEQVAQIDPEKNRFGDIRVDTIQEIGVNKICTLVGRCESKDLIDLYFLCKQGFDILEQLPNAQKKEGGLDPATLSFLLSDIEIHSRPEYLLKSLDIGDFLRFIDDLRKQFAALSFPQQ